MRRARRIALIAFFPAILAADAIAACLPADCEGKPAGFRLPSTTTCATLASWDDAAVPNCGTCVCGGTEGEWWCDTTALPNNCVGIAPPAAAPNPAAPQAPIALPAGAHDCDGTSVNSAGAAANTLANPKLGCCMNGWRETTPGPGTDKFDCVESRPVAAAGVAGSFDTYYNVATDAAGVAFPNQLFLVNPGGEPVTGFYDEQGIRCGYATGPRSAANQLADIRTTLAQRAADPSGYYLPPGIPARCPFLVRTALEVICPPNPSAAGGPAWTAVGPRCTSAGSFRIHFAIDDLSNPAVTKRARFKQAATIIPVSAPGDFPYEDLARTEPMSIQEVFRRRQGCPLTAGWKFAGGLCARQ